MRLLFSGLSPLQISTLREDPLIRALFPVATGYFPAVADHVLLNRTIAEHVFIYCERGAGWLRLDSQQFPVGAGDILVCPAGTNHSYGADSRTPWTIAWAHYTGTASEHVLGLLGLSREAPVRRVGAVSAIASGIREITAAMHLMADQGMRFANCARFAAVLDACVRGTRSLPRSSPLRRALRLLHEDSAREHTVVEMARAAGWSTSHLTRVFRQKLGLPPLAYLQQVRLQQAAQLLIVEAELPISEVAARVGYPDPYYFSRIFRKSMGVAPSAYRQLHLGRSSG